MVQNLARFSYQQLRQQLEKMLIQVLSEQEFSNCFKQIEIQKPTAGKCFWQTVDAPWLENDQLHFTADRIRWPESWQDKFESSYSLAG